MVGTAIWWTKEEAERDAAETRLPVVGLGPMTESTDIDQLQLEIAELQLALTMHDDAAIQDECIRAENSELRAQLAEAQALLRDIDDWMDREDRTPGFEIENRMAEFLRSASAEPSAPIWSCQSCQLEQPTDRPCDVCGGKTEPVATKP